MHANGKSKRPGRPCSLVPEFLRSEKISMNDGLRGQAPGKFATLSAGRTHYIQSGPEAGPIVVLIPGATIPCFVWEPLLPILGAAGYRTITYDLYGRGYSDRPELVYDSDLHRTQLEELLEYLYVRKPVHLVQLAFGALIGAAFALARPRQVLGWTAIGADGFGVRFSLAGRLLQTPYLGDSLFDLIGNRFLVGRMRDYARDPARVADITNRYAATLQWKGFKRAVSSSVRNMPIHDSAQLYRRMSEQGTRALIVYGRDDRVTPYPGEERLRRAFPQNAEFHVLEGVGHLPQVELPEQTGDLILRFLGNCDTPPTGK
ncbi:MAG: alpha/beta hydrolase [Leptospirales bacterium]|jgi:pimeloyl-ACP methyl ester carboxylesterase